MITVQDFYQTLISDISLSANVSGSVVENEFLVYALDQLVECGEINQYDLIEDGRDATGAWRIDAISIDDAGELSTGAITLFISLFESVDQPSNLIQSELGSILKKIKRFVEFSLEKDIYSFFEPGGDAFGAALEIRSRWSNGDKKLKFIIVSNRPASTRIKDLELIEVADSKAEVVVWDLNRFFQLELSGREREDLDIDLSDKPIQALLASNVDSDMKSILAVVPAKVLVEIYGRWGGRLLEQNVRSFLTAKGKVNKGIRETIKNTPSKFFAFNNGITGTAEDVTLESRADGLFITKLKNFQIVNGGQTTASLYSAAIKDKFDVSDIYVQMKLSVVEPDKAKDLVPYISRYANSQNKVTEADLFSNHPFHVRFEEFSRRITPPPKAGSMISEKWFYERARGQYLNEQAYLSVAERAKFQLQNPKSQVITKTALAKYLNSFDMLPFVVSKGAEINFSKFAEKTADQWSRSEAEIHEGYYRNAISKAIIFKEIELLVSSQRDVWYNGHRDKIVPYTIAFLMYAIELNKKEFDYELVWKKQSMNDQLRAVFTDIAESINTMLHDPSRPFGNVAEYAKRELFWNVVKEKASTFDVSTINQSLITKREASSRKSDEKEKQQLTNKLEIETKVKLTSAETWKLVYQYLVDNDIETPAKKSLLQRATSNPLSLSQLQCGVLYTILRDYESHFRG